MQKIVIECVTYKMLVIVSVFMVTSELGNDSMMYSQESPSFSSSSGVGIGLVLELDSIPSYLQTRTMRRGLLGMKA